MAENEITSRYAIEVQRLLELNPDGLTLDQLVASVESNLQLAGLKKAVDSRIRRRIKKGELVKLDNNIIKIKDDAAVPGGQVAVVDDAGGPQAEEVRLSRKQMKKAAREAKEAQRRAENAARNQERDDRFVRDLMVMDAAYPQDSTGHDGGPSTSE